jgi:tetratricopeptide (TPR) repeat protein
VRIAPPAASRATGWLVALIVIAMASSCAKKVATVVPGGPDRFPDFSYPLVPEDLAKTSPLMVRSHDDAWRLLQRGDPREAERAFAAILKTRADFYPAEAGLAYVEIARGNEPEAVDRFTQVLARSPQYMPALMGRAQTLLHLDRTDEALAAFEAVLAVDPSLTDIRQRVEGLRFRALEAALSNARLARDAGRFEEARALYQQAIASSPESAFLYRELAQIDHRLARLEDATEDALKAVSLDPSDGAAYLLLADVYEQKLQWDEAIDALEHARAVDATADIQERLQSLRRRAALARLPEQYHAIPRTERLTRGELAALIGARFEPVLRTVRTSQSSVITDVRADWAQTWIMLVVQANVMDVFDNHTFQPRTIVRRGDLARAITGVLTLIAQRDPALGKSWADNRREFADLSPANLYYGAASLAVTAGILDTAPGEIFQAGRVVSGAEAVDAMDRLEKLAAQARGLPRGH